jgi:hypothetical protein
MTRAEEIKHRTNHLVADYARLRFGKPWYFTTPEQQFESRDWAEHIAEHPCCMEDAHLWLVGDPLTNEEPCVRELMLETDRLYRKES